MVAPTHHDSPPGHGAGSHGQGPGASAPDRTPLIVIGAWVVFAVSVSGLLASNALPTNLDAVPFAILLLPLVGFTVLALFGDAIRDQGEAAGAAVLACLTVLTSFVLSVATVMRVVGFTADAAGLRFTQPYLNIEIVDSAGARWEIAWIAVGSLRVPFSLLIDNLSSVMMLVVTGVGSLIHIYSVGYMAHDPERVRYFSYLNLFTFFMLLLVMGGSLPLMFVGWEGVGLCSYLLIGFWFQKKSASDAGKKAFIVNRIGDAGLILGMILAFHVLGTLDLVDLASTAAAKPAEAGFGVITALCLLMFVGACGKSAQIPLHTWLPDAMEGPTPVSALIHAATMVTAGVYMVARLAPLYALSPIAMNVVAIVGLATAVLGATVALVQTDIKRVLAYSTVSQLGYMFLACGVGAFGVAVFHLYTHAFFKALLFLGSGSVIHALSGEQDMRKMGGLARKIRWTFGTFVIGTAAISGIPFLSGFYSKDAILAGTLAAGRPVLFGVGMAVALLTAFYMSRLLILTFLGTYRGDPETEAHVHESPASMVVPLVLLALGSIAAGWVDIPGFVSPAFRLEAAHEHHGKIVPALAIASAFLGIAAAVYFFVLRPDLPRQIYARFAGVARVLEAKYGFDHLYDWIVARVVVDGSRTGLWRGFDVRVIDGAVNGTATLAAALARAARPAQTGLVRAYALVILGGAVLLLSYLVWQR